MSKINKIGTYNILQTIHNGKDTELYVCERVGNEGFKFLLKKQLEQTMVAEHEKIISQKIEQYAPKSIVIPVLYSEKINEETYSIMEFRKNGMFLSDFLEEVDKGELQLDLNDICQILFGILDSLECLHNCLNDENEKGVLHADLHPGNIFLESCIPEKHVWGHAKFIDFENSMLIQKDGSVVKNSFGIGYTNGYFAPETRLFTKNILSECVDIYSVTAILARIITGKSVEGSYETYLDILDRCLQTGEKLTDSKIKDEYLMKIIRIGLEDSPKYRIQNAEEFRTFICEMLDLDEALKKRDYYESLKLAYYMNISKEACRGLEFDPKAYHVAIEKLCNGLLQDNTKAHMHRWVYENLYEMLKLNEKNIQESDKAYLMYCGISIYNHHGNSKAAIECYEVLEKNRKNIKPIDWMAANNRVCVSYADAFQHDKAKVISKSNIVKLEKLKRTYYEILDLEVEEKSSGDLEFGRSYSAYGSYLAYEESKECLVYFDKALEEFRNSPGNKAITVSHVLHYAIQKNNWNLYEKYYKILEKGNFSENNEVEIYLRTDSEKRKLYNLYLFLKTVNWRECFSEFAMLQESIKKLLSDGIFLREMDFPISLILKHCGEILWKLNDQEMTLLAERCFKLAIGKLETEHKRSENGLDVMKIISYSIESSYLLKSGKAERAKMLYDEFMQRLHDEKLTELEEYICNVNSSEEKMPYKIILKYEYT